MFTAESAGARLLKIGQRLTKLWPRVGCPLFFFCDSRYICVGMLNINITIIIVIIKTRLTENINYKKVKLKARNIRERASSLPSGFFCVSSDWQPCQTI